MLFKQRSKTVKIFAHHRAYQELSVSKQPGISSFDWGQLGVYIRRFLSVAWQAVTWALAAVFALCFWVGSVLVRGSGWFMSRLSDRRNFDVQLTALDAMVVPQFRVPGVLALSHVRLTLSIFSGFLLICFIFLQAGTLVTHGLETKTAVLGAADEGLRNLQEAQELLKKQNPEQAGQKFSSALTNFQNSQKELTETGVVLHSLLALVPQKRTADSLLQATTLISRAGVLMSETLADVSDITVTAQGIDGNGAFEKLQQAYKALVTAKDYARKAVALIDSVGVDDIPSGQKETFVAAQGKLTLLDNSLDTLDRVFHFVLTLLGGDKKVLVFFQNNNELRPSGGFMGTYGIFDVHNGTIEQSHISSIYDLDGQLVEAIAPPHPLRVLSDKWYLRDSNWFFDFRETSQAITTMYEKEGGETPDVIMVMTPQLIIDLLQLTGPVSLHQYGVVLDENNFVEETQLQTSVKYDKTENKPKQMLADFMPIFLQRLSHLSAGDYVEFVQALQRDLAEKHILLYARDSETEQLINEFHWGGEVVASDRDYLAVVSANVGGTKTDLGITQSVKLDTVVDRDGLITNTLTITRSNSLPDADGLENISFLRVFVPSGAELIKAVGFSEKPLPFVESGNYKTNAQVAAWEANLSKNVVTGMVTGAEAGKTFFGNWLVVPGGTSKTVTLTYTLPQHLQTTDRYSLIVQKQPGVGSFDFEHAMHFPNFQLIWSNVQPDDASSHEFDLHTKIVRDMLFGYVLQKSY